METIQNQMVCIISDLCVVDVVGDNGGGGGSSDVSRFVSVSLNVECAQHAAGQTANRQFIQWCVEKRVGFEFFFYFSFTLALCLRVYISFWSFG